MNTAFGSVTSAHTYLPPFFLLFNHIPNDYKFSEKHSYSYMFWSLKCQKLGFLAIDCPFFQVALSCICCFIQLPPQESPPQGYLCQLFSFCPKLGPVPGVSFPFILLSSRCQVGTSQDLGSSPASPTQVPWHKIILWILSQALVSKS